MDAVTRYGFINAKLRARIGLMRQSSLTDDMMKAPTLLDAVGCLRQSGFKALADIYDRTGDLEEMGLALFSSEVAAYQEVASLVDKRLSSFVLVLLGKLEEENLKNVVRLWYSSVIRLHAIRWRSAYLYKQRIASPIDWNGMLNATDWDGLRHGVAGTIYEPVFRGFSEEDIRKNDLFDLEIALDKAWYADLEKATRELPAEDRAEAMRIFHRDFDLKNLLKLVRFGRFYRLDGTRLKGILLPWGRLYASKEAARFMAADPSQRDVMPLVRSFVPELTDAFRDDGRLMADDAHAEQVLADETLRIEEALGAERRKEYARLLTGQPFSIGIMLTYFYEYRRKTSMIRAILNGKFYGYTQERIREALG